ncbi:extracellular solute-binding protein [Hoeflea sp. WL0058]|uniref:Extracellular solute-binding protein n=1 Tax=Flavimaribacter sediminis TaxID=2865987 RepID=A0AAE2ZJQ5_9HYPH|nr:extracellular solute-binding protein [Flavimaribacter sediminis]MBW8638074.1 extracellular solute-binding protein [Flavimaribacter sediminis]
MAAIDRRTFLLASGLGAASLLTPARFAFAQVPSNRRLHGISAFGDLKYPADFTHFDYVDPQAPKGGLFNFQPPSWQYNQNVQTFNTLNSFILRGDAPPRMELCFDSLMVRALDEPDAQYCHLAEWVEVSDDRNIWRFGLRLEARFHDGSPVTAADAAYSYNLLKEEGHPNIVITLREMTEAVAIDERTLELRFSGDQSANAILAAVEIPVLSKAYYSDRPFDSSTLDIPLSSGAYRPSRVDAGRFIEYGRVEDYWGRDLPTVMGQNNFDTLRIEFFADRQAGFEQFKKGEIQFRQEFTSKSWATEYNFPAITQGRVIKRTFPAERRPMMQAWPVNQRRARFSDWRVRQAINLCFDFRWTNDKIFYNAYERSQSLFEKSEFVATGMPTDAELAILEPLRERLPEAAFGEAVTQPVSDGSGRDRALLRQAVTLLDEAGWKRDGQVLKKDGETLSVEILIRSPVFERVLSGLVENMRRVGIETSIRLVDPVQFQSRLDTFDFDMVGLALSMSATPTRENLASMFSDSFAAVEGSNNYPGAQSGVYDDLLAHVGKAESREALVTAMRALDRVERARLDWIPNWYSADHKVAFWDMFGFPDTKPDYGWPVESLWWFDKEKARAIGR